MPGIGSSARNKHIEYFNPDVVVLSDWHQDFSFNTEKGYENFDDLARSPTINITVVGFFIA